MHSTHCSITSVVTMSVALVLPLLKRPDRSKKPALSTRCRKAVRPSSPDVTSESRSVEKEYSVSRYTLIIQCF